MGVIRCGDFACMRFQIFDRQVRHIPFRIPGATGSFIDYCLCATLDRVGDVVATIGFVTRIGKESIALRNTTRIRRELGLGRVNGQPVEDVCERGRGQDRHYIFSCSEPAGMMILVTLESGATFIERKAFAVTVANTGAAT